MNHPASTMDRQVFRQVMSAYPTGVVVVTALDDGAPVSLVVGTFNSVSLDPPLVGFLPMKSSRRFEAIRRSEDFTVNFLASDQLDLCDAVSRNNAPFENFDWRPGLNGMPIFDNVIASIDCRHHETVDAGDHFYYMGSVQRLQIHRTAPPLVFFQGEFGSFGQIQKRSDLPLIRALESVLPLNPRLLLLSRKLGAEITVLSRSHNEMIITSVMDARGVEKPEMLGRRVPLIPPLGEFFAAWDGHLQDEWLESADPEVRELLNQRLRGAIESGWAISLNTEYRVEAVTPAVRNFQSNPYTPQGFRDLEQVINKAHKYYAPTDLSAGRSYEVAGITVPLTKNGEIHSVLRVADFSTPLNREEIYEIVEQIKVFANLADKQHS